LLLDSDRFGKVAGLVNIVATEHSQMEGEQLQRDNVEDHLQRRTDVRNFKELGGSILHHFITNIAHNDGLALASFHLLNGILYAAVGIILCCNEEDWHGFIDQGEGSMLEFTSKNTLRVEVRDFLDFPVSQSVEQAS